MLFIRSCLRLLVMKNVLVKNLSHDSFGFFLLLPGQLQYTLMHMTRGILIVGNDAPLSHAFVSEAAKRVDAVAAAFAPDPLLRLNDEDAPESETAPAPEEGSAVISLPWNPSSAISSRALVTAARNKLQHIDDAVLLCTPYALRKKADELNPAEIEVLIADQIMSWFFLVRDLSACFHSQARGTLSLILSDTAGTGTREEQVDLIGPSVAASFRALAQGVLASSFSESYNVLGFSSSEIGDEVGFASYAFKIIDESSKRSAGKWYKYGRLGLFKR